MLAGYDMEVLARQFDRMSPAARLPSLARSALSAVASRMRRPLVASILRGGASGALGDIRAHMTRVWTEQEKAQFWRGARDLHSTDDLIKSWYDDCVSPSPIDQMQQVYCRSWLVEDLLMKADKMSMAASLELRCPFLDHSLVEWCARLPLEWKVGSRQLGYRSKRILRDYAAKRLPAEIIDRPKRGFPVPAYQWLERGLGPWARDRINSGRLKSWIDVKALSPVTQAAEHGSRAAQHQVWSLRGTRSLARGMDVRLLFLSWSYPPMPYPRATQVARLAAHVKSRPLEIYCLAPSGDRPVPSRDPSSGIDLVRIPRSLPTRILERVFSERRHRTLQEYDVRYFWWRRAARHIIRDASVERRRLGDFRPADGRSPGRAEDKAEDRCPLDRAFQRSLGRQSLRSRKQRTGWPVKPRCCNRPILPFSRRRKPSTLSMRNTLMRGARRRGCCRMRTMHRFIPRQAGKTNM